MRIKLLLISFFIFIYGNSQELQNSNWCFGANARVSFAPPPPVASSCAIVPSIPVGGTYAGGSVSDDNGNLLFYTNGVIIWDKNHVPMPNGNQLLGEVGFQNIIIIPKPDQPNIYYIFTGIPFYSTGSPPSLRFGIYYTVVDLSLNNSNGDVVSGLKNIPLKNHAGVAIDNHYWAGGGPRMDVIKMTTAMNQTQDGIWATFFVKYTDNGVLNRYVYSYLVTSNGINNTADGTSPMPATSTLIDNNNYPGQSINDWFGYIKISPNRQFLCDATPVAVNLYNFNSQTGTVTFNAQVYTPTTTGTNAGYGLEFSPNSQFLYFSAYNNAILQARQGGMKGSGNHYVSIFQNRIGLNKNVIIGSFPIKLDTIINRSSRMTNIVAAQPYNLQLSINNKIYVCNASNQPGTLNYNQLGVIDQPDLAYPACNYQGIGVQLQPGTNHWFGLPQWVHKVRPKWPKVYSGKAPEYLWHDEAGNTFLLLHDADILVPPFNHYGPLPTAQWGDYCIQYNNAGITDWTQTDILPTFVLASGDIQFSNSTYYNGNTGSPSTPPSLVPFGQNIIAESNGTYITYAFGTGAIYVHSSSGTTSINGGTVFKTFFNTVTKKLFVQRLTGGISLDVYTLTGNSLQLNSSVLLPQTNYPDELVQIDNQDRVLYVFNNVLQEFNYIQGTLSPIPINGLPNNNIWRIKMSNPYTNDGLLVYNSSDKNIYAINLSNNTSRKIATDNFFSPWSYGFIKGDDVFLASGNELNPNIITIGNQTVTPLSPVNTSIWITKLSLQTDFTLRTMPDFVTPNLPKGPPFDILFFPNPTNSLTKVSVQRQENAPDQEYSLSVFDQGGHKLLQIDRFQAGNDINISDLNPGIYFVEMKNKKGERVTKMLRKI